MSGLRSSVSGVGKADDWDNRVRQWRDSSVGGPPVNHIVQAQPDGGGIIARLFQECVSLYKTLLCELQQSTAPWSLRERKLKRVFGQLKLWGDAYDVRDGQLDKILDTSSEVRITTVSILIAIGEILCTGEPLQL
jgi:hypothetical protein